MARGTSPRLRPTRACSGRLRLAALGSPPLKRQPLGADGWNVESVIFVLPAGPVARRGGSPAGVTFGDGREGQGDLPAIPARTAARTGHGPGHGFAWRLARRPGWLALRSRLYEARVSRPDVSLLPGAGWSEGQVGWPAVAGPGVAVAGRWVFWQLHFARGGAMMMLVCGDTRRTSHEGHGQEGRRWCVAPFRTCAQHALPADARSARAAEAQAVSPLAVK